MAEYNPYEPPKSAVADRPKPRLPRTVRVLRALAVIGSALTGLISLVMPFAVPGSAVSGALMIAALLLVLALTSILALVSRVAENRVYWTAMGTNAVTILLLNLGAAKGSLLFIVPALLNMVAIELLRRARLVLEASENAPSQ